MADQVRLSIGSESYKTMETRGAARDTGNRFGAVEMTYRERERGGRKSVGRSKGRGLRHEV